MLSLLLVMSQLNLFTLTHPTMLPQQIKRIHIPTPRTLNLPILTTPHMFLQLPQLHLLTTKNTHRHVITIIDIILDMGMVGLLLLRMRMRMRMMTRLI